LPSFLVANVGMKEEQIKWIYFFGGLGTLLTMAPIGRSYSPSRPLAKQT
jgi:hypothetical protein